MSFLNYKDPVVNDIVDSLNIFSIEFVCLVSLLALLLPVIVEKTFSLVTLVRFYWLEFSSTLRQNGFDAEHHRRSFIVSSIVVFIVLMHIIVGCMLSFDLVSVPRINKIDNMKQLSETNFSISVIEGIGTRQDFLASNDPFVKKIFTDPKRKFAPMHVEDMMEHHTDKLYDVCNVILGPDYGINIIRRVFCQIIRSDPKLSETYRSYTSRESYKINLMSLVFSLSPNETQYKEKDDYVRMQM